MGALPIFCFVWTLGLYFAAKKLYTHFPRIWLAPAIVVPTLTIAMMLLAHIPYSAYSADTHWITWLLGPATIAFAVPIYEHREIARRNWIALSLGVCVGMTVALTSSLFLARVLHLDEVVALSLMARSVSTPFAITLVGRTGGSPELVALFTVITGLVGMIAGDFVLALLKLRSSIAHGASFGAAAHGFGTARARERNAEEGVIASLTMVLSGLLMVIAGPAVTHAAWALFG